MKSTLCFLLLFLFGSIYLSGQNWQVVWHDEFDGDSLDAGKWSYQTGTGAEYGLTDWGNGELQYYRERNVTVGEGMLTVTAKKEYYRGKAYTSGRIRTIGKGDWKYCRIEFRAKMPLGKGLWAAVWMLPTDEVYGGWAASGELDIMEYLGHESRKVHGTLHFGQSWPHNEYKGIDYDLSTSDFHTEFHDFALEWIEGEIRWYVDNTLYQTLGSGDWWTNGGGFPAPFNQEFHLLINLAVGGNWPGEPNSTTRFPQDLVIDYIRIFQDLPLGTDEEMVKEQEQSGLLQNFPNPFQKTTTISYSLPEAEHVTLELFDTKGRKIRTLEETDRTPGRYQVQMDGSTLPPGLYTCILTAGKTRVFKRLVLLGN